ncbi:MAG TPA: flagellar hook-length control protein FliK [Paraburkholderia sp.]|nr:flagellar hook-length control protein FliK [Paraburkholderia sp.]
MIERTFADMLLASIASVLPTSNAASAAPSSVADSQDGDFHAVLASYAPVAQPAHEVAARETRAVKPIEAIDRVAPAAGQTKGSKKSERDDEKEAVKKTANDSKSSPNAQPVAAVTPQPVRAIVQSIATPPPSEGDDADSDDSAQDATAILANVDDAANALANIQPRRAPIQAGKSSQSMNTPPRQAPADIAASAQDDTRSPASAARKQASDEITSIPRNAAAPSDSKISTPTQTNALPKQAVDEIIAAAKSATQQPAPATAPSATQSSATDIASMLKAARGSVTVTTSPKPVVASNDDAKPDTATTGKPAAVTDSAKVQQPDANAKVAQDAKSDSRDTLQDARSPASGADAQADPAPVNVVSQPAPQIAANTNLVATATPNVVNSTAPVQPAAAAHPMPADPQAPSQPNIAALATAIAAKSVGGTKTFDIRMDPPELGRVDVHLTVDRDGKVQATLSAEHPQTLELLQRDSQSLERALKDSGLSLSNNGLNFSLKGEGRQGDGGGASMARARSLPDAVVARAEAANASISNINSASGNGRLDIRV